MPENRYSEAIEFLYAENTFDFNHPQSITHLSQTVTPHRFSLITAIRLNWWTPERLFSPTRPLESADVARMWVDARFIVARMPSLRELRILMCDGRGLVSFEEQFLSPLMGVQQVEIFEVFVPWLGKYIDPNDIRWIDAPFILKRDHDYTAMTGGE